MFQHSVAVKYRVIVIGISALRELLPPLSPAAVFLSAEYSDKSSHCLEPDSVVFGELCFVSAR